MLCLNNIVVCLWLTLHICEKNCVFSLNNLRRLTWTCVDGSEIDQQIIILQFQTNLCGYFFNECIKLDSNDA